MPASPINHSATNVTRTNGFTFDASMNVFDASSSSSLADVTIVQTGSVPPRPLFKLVNNRLQYFPLPSDIAGGECSGHSHLNPEREYPWDLKVLADRLKRRLKYAHVKVLLGCEYLNSDQFDSIFSQSSIDGADDLDAFEESVAFQNSPRVCASQDEQSVAPSEGQSENNEEVAYPPPSHHNQQNGSGNSQEYQLDALDILAGLALCKQTEDLPIETNDTFAINPDVHNQNDNDSIIAFPDHHHHHSHSQSPIMNEEEGIISRYSGERGGALYPNLHEFTNGQWSHYLQILDSRCKPSSELEAERYGHLGPPRQDPAQISLMLREYSDELARIKLQRELEQRRIMHQLMISQKQQQVQQYARQQQQMYQQLNFGKEQPPNTPMQLLPPRDGRSWTSGALPPTPLATVTTTIPTAPKRTYSGTPITPTLPPTPLLRHNQIREYQQHPQQTPPPPLASPKMSNEVAKKLCMHYNSIIQQLTRDEAAGRQLTPQELRQIHQLRLTIALYGSPSAVVDQKLEHHRGLEQVDDDEHQGVSPCKKLQKLESKQPQATTSADNHREEESLAAKVGSHNMKHGSNLSDGEGETGQAGDIADEYLVD